MPYKIEYCGGPKPWKIKSIRVPGKDRWGRPRKRTIDNRSKQAQSRKRKFEELLDDIWKLDERANRNREGTQKGKGTRRRGSKSFKRGRAQMWAERAGFHT